MKYLGTAACPPYHIAVVIGGTSADACLKTVKLASAKYWTDCPPRGTSMARPSATWSWRERLLEAAYKLGIGAQFGGKYFAHDVRVIRLPRHGASCPVGMAVSCSADRNIKAKITRGRPVRRGAGPQSGPPDPRRSTAASTSTASRST